MKKKGSLKVRKKRMLLFSLVQVYVFKMITTKLLTHSRFYSLKKKHNFVKRLKNHPLLGFIQEHH